MKIETFENPDLLFSIASEQVVTQISKNSRSVLGLPAGNTPGPLYAKLIEHFLAHKISFSEVTTFGLDEYVGVDSKHTLSFQRYVRERFIDRANFDSSRVHFLRGTAEDKDLECGNYEIIIKQSGGID